MPRMDGFTVVRELRENPRYRKLPIMILTTVREDASYRRYELEMGGRMDVQDYIEKFPASDRAGLYTVMGLTLNTIAYNLAKAELEAEA